MTVQLNFDKANQQRLLPLLEWLREIGLVKSFQIADAAAPSSVDSEVFLNRILENAEKDIAEGNLMTSEEVTQNLGLFTELIKRDKTGTLSQLTPIILANLLQKAKLRMSQRLVVADKAPNELLIAFAAQLYDKEILSAGQAAGFAGLPKADFIRQMGKYQVSPFGETLEEITAL